VTYESLIATASQRTVGLVAFSLVVLVAGYVLVGALFYFMVYKPSRDEKAAKRAEAEREEAEQDLPADSE
jgi:preprotein translocase subunit YajC